MVSSRDLPPRTEGFNTIFLKSQLCTKVKFPPKDTNMNGMVAIITGAGSGLGYECSRQMLSLGLSHLIMGVRSTERGEVAASKLRSTYPQAVIDVWALEMESYQSVQDFVRKCDVELSRLDIAVLNSGVTHHKFELVPSTGHERTIQVNYLSTMLVAILLLPIIKRLAARSPGRLTIVNSGVSLGAKFPNHQQRPLLKSFDDTNITPWDPVERYYSSKLLGQLFLVKLIDYIQADDVIVNIVEPGFVKGTGLHRDTTGIASTILSALKTMTGRTMEEGASTYIDAAVIKGKESHGCFLMDCEIKPFAAFVYRSEGNPAIQQLWTETMEEFKFVGAQQILESLRG